MEWFTILLLLVVLACPVGMMWMHRRHDRSAKGADTHMRGESHSDDDPLIRKRELDGL